MAMSNYSSSVCPGTLFPYAYMAPGFCSIEIPIPVSQARSILSFGTSDALILERGAQAVTLLQDLDGDLVPETKTQLVSASGLNHGLALRDNYIFASSDTTVYRWSYSGLFDELSVEPTVVVSNINADGQGGAPMGHSTRTLIFDDLGRLYIAVGSLGNIDENSFRSRIRRFDISDETTFPLDFLTGEVFADGLRNEVGLAFDKFGVLWGVENSADNLDRTDLGVEIFQDNPAEELHRFPEEMAGSHYGYPYCWTEYLLSETVSRGRGSVWAWPAVFPNNTVYTDEQCQNDFVAPQLAMQAHSAPLGIKFYEWMPDSARPSGCTGGFPDSMDGYAFIAFHGSWNRDIPTGYKVVYVPIDSEGMVAGEPIDLLAHVPPNAQWEDGFRPVDVAFDECGRLLVTSDGSRGVGSKIVRVESTGLLNNSTASVSQLPTSSTAPTTFVPTGESQSTNVPSPVVPATSMLTLAPSPLSTPGVTNDTTNNDPTTVASTLSPTMVPTPAMSTSGSYTLITTTPNQPVSSTTSSDLSITSPAPSSVNPSSPTERFSMPSMTSQGDGVVGVGRFLALTVFTLLILLR